MTTSNRVCSDTGEHARELSWSKRTSTGSFARPVSMLFMLSAQVNIPAHHPSSALSADTSTLGHGAPTILSCLWLEDSLSTFLPDYPREYSGLKKLIAAFSAPGGFPRFVPCTTSTAIHRSLKPHYSHINAETPGAIHEGDELGYALSVSFGAVMDNPDLVVACIIGDGEAESGPTAAAWHAYKYTDQHRSGAVLLILHVNGFKISERTIFGVMDDKEIIALFTYVIPSLH